MTGQGIRKGTTIDGFLVGELIHQGSMSILRRVTHPGMPMAMLLKAPLLLEGGDPAAIVGFEMEQLVLPRLAGVHVPRFVAAGDFPAQPYVVLEYVSSESLLARKERVPLPYEEVAEIGVKVATALDDIHRQHVVHFDVKPSNVVLRSTGEAVLIDYGLAHHDQLPDLMEEEFRVPYGTAPYMAPEQILGNRRDPRSDLFSLGVLLYFYSTGKRPFGDPSGRRALRRRLWRDPVPPRRIRPDYPPGLQEIVLRCLEVDPARRHPTAAQLAFDLSHTDQVKLTGRSERLARDSWGVVLRRRFNPEGDEAPPLREAVAAGIASAPIVLIGIDLRDESAALADALRVTVKRMLDTVPKARFAFVNVLKQKRIGLDTTLDEEGRNKHLLRLVALRHWAKPLNLAEGRITFHVLQSTDPADAILDYALTNRVDHIVLGARTALMRRNYLGSVSGQVALKARCTVTVVRPPRPSDGCAPAVPLTRDESSVPLPPRQE